MPSVDNSQKCICQICTCGRHRCPHRPGTRLQLGQPHEGVTVTEYNDRFKDSERFRREPYRRAKDNLGFTGDKLEDATVTRSDYVPQKSERTQAIRNQDSLRHQGDHDMNTVYKSQYDGKQGERNLPRPLRKDNLGNSSARFNAKPLYKDDYQSWPLERAERVNRPDGIVSSEEPFDGNTTNRLAYTDREMGERQQHARPRTTTRLEGDFNGTSTVRDDYRGRPGERARPLKPPTAPPASGHFDSSTTNLADYRPRAAGERTRGLRPATNTRLGGDFDGGTTHRDVYQGVQGSKQASFKPAGHFQSVDPFDSHTTQRGDYTDKSGPRTKANRPTTATRLSGDFTTETTNGVDYLPWQAQRPEFRRPLAYVRPEGDIDLNTVTRADYGGDPRGERAKLVRHPGANLFDSSPLDGTTSYRSEYVQHGLGPCPAEGLAGQGNGNDEFRYRTEVGGHHFFMPALPIR